MQKHKIDFVFSFSVLTEVGNNEYKDSRFVSFGLYCETTSPYIHAASEIVDSHIDPQRIQELTLALQLLRENGECNCSDCQHEKKKQLTKQQTRQPYTEIKNPAAQATGLPLRHCIRRNQTKGR